MKAELKQLLYVVQDWNRMRKIASESQYDKERQRSLIVRLLHSIEKGLCLEAPRMGFGVAKLKDLKAQCEAFAKKYGADEYCLQMARDVFNEYLAFHTTKGFENNDIVLIRKLADEINRLVKPCVQRAGGTVIVRPHEELATVRSIEDLLNLRHSVREFAQETIPNEEILQAVRLAQRCPSACNRQAVRAYVLPAKKLCELYDNNLSGIGGFAENADKFILITGKISAYSFTEYNQYIVSASMFASYLALTLLTTNIGSCIVQRPLRNTKQFKAIAKACQIPGDEQMVMMMAIGRLKEQYKAPYSGRFPAEEIIRFCE